MRKRKVDGRIYGMKYSWKGHKDRNRHKNRIKRRRLARLVYVKNINCNIPTTWRWPRGDSLKGKSEIDGSFHIPKSFTLYGLITFRIKRGLRNKSGCHRDRWQGVLNARSTFLTWRAGQKSNVSNFARRFVPLSQEFFLPVGLMSSAFRSGFFNFIYSLTSSDIKWRVTRTSRLFVVWWIVHRPDLTFVVDWELKWSVWITESQTVWIWSLSHVL